MKLRTAFIIAGGLVLGGIGLVTAQVIPQPGPPMPIGCAFNTSPPALSDGQAGWVQCTNDGKIQVDASVTTTASVTGWPGSTQTTGTPISVTTGGDTGSLPSGAVVLATNDGATNTAYCKLGASATVNDAPVYPHSSVAFTVGSATQLTCITSTSTTTIKMAGGAGLPTGWGGGSASGGSGGSVTQGTVPWVVSNAGTFATQSAQSGTWTVQPGNTANTTAWLVTGTGGTFPATQSGTWNITNVSGTVSLPTGAATAAKQDDIVNAINGSIPAGTAIIGKVGIDQTTPGTTNGVSPSLTNAVWGTTSAMTGTTSTSLIAGTTSKLTYVTALTCVNSHATVGTFVTIQDGSGGTALGTVAAAAVFGGTVLQAGGAPLFPPTTSGNGVFVADVTTGANVICTASGFHS